MSATETLRRPRGRPAGVRNSPHAVPDDTRRVLVPFWTVEAVSAPEAAMWAGVSVTTLHRWCKVHALGRPIGGRWQVSRLALPMFMSGDHVALAAYHAGDRTSRLVLDYFGHMLGPRAMCQE